MLGSGEFATIAELAEREGIAPSYMTRLLRLTLLAPDIVETILHGTQRLEVTLERVRGEISVGCVEQEQSFRPLSLEGYLGSWATPRSRE